MDAVDAVFEIGVYLTRVADGGMIVFRTSRWKLDTLRRLARFVENVNRLLWIVCSVQTCLCKFDLVCQQLVAILWNWQSCFVTSLFSQRWTGMELLTDSWILAGYRPPLMAQRGTFSQSTAQRF